MKSNIVSSLIERAAPDADYAAEKAGNVNVKNLISEFKKLGLKITRDAGNKDTYTLAGCEKLGTKKSEITSKVRAAMTSAGWTSQGSGLFPDPDNQYFFQAKTGKSRELDSQGVLSVNACSLFVMAVGNW